MFRHRFAVLPWQVIYQMYCITLESLNRAASNFERYEQLTSLAVPPELYMQQVGQQSTAGLVEP